MAFICVSTSHVAVAASRNVFAVSRTAAKDASNKPLVLSAHLNQSDSKNDEDDSDEAPGDHKSTSAKPSCLVVAATFSPSEAYFAVANNWKQLLLWRTNEDEWHLVKHWNLSKQATAIVITADDGWILVADRHGRVIRYSISGNIPSSVLLGHVSLLLDACLSRSERFILTADRDEKIRVSHYPHGYDIETYCLGHTSYIRTLCICSIGDRTDCSDHDEFLASGAGDGIIMFWDYLKGRLLATFDVKTSEALAGETGDVPVEKIVCIGHDREAKSFRLAALLDNTEDGVAKSLALGGDRLYVLMATSKENSCIEIDIQKDVPTLVSSAEASASVEALNSLTTLRQSVNSSQSSLPPLEKQCQFDNIGQYLKEKQARLEKQNPAQGDNCT